MNTGIYVRISLDVAGEGLGVERQEQLCRIKAAELGWTVSKVYRDNDVSATSAKERPAYRELLADLGAGVIGSVVVYAIDRLTRKPMELEQLISLVEDKGIIIKNLAGDIDLSTPMGQLMGRMMGNFARLEVQNIGKRVRDEKIQRAGKGIPHKGRHRQFGYDSDWKEIRPEADLVREAFTRRAHGESTNSICEDFKRRDVRGVSGVLMQQNSLARILTNPIYKGRVTFKGVEVSDSIYGAIVDPVSWEQAQSHLANSSKGTNARRYLLSGIAVCGHDFVEMKGNPNGMYRCAENYNGCGRLSIRIEIADRWALWAAMNKRAETPQKATTRPRNYQTEIDALAIDLERVQRMTRDEVYTTTEGAAEVKILNQQIRALVKEQALNTPKQNKVTQTYLDYHRMNLSQKRAFLSETIRTITIKPTISKGNQPFNPARMEFSFFDGTTYVPAPEDYSPDFQETQIEES